MLYLMVILSVTLDDP